ncbi:hypothetical protein JCM8097_009215 [Rhodosporidiobolus ruineniae]
MQLTLVPLPASPVSPHFDKPCVYACKTCGTRWTTSAELERTGFHSPRGVAYLFNLVVNVRLSEPQERKLLTGVHTVQDVACCRCKEKIGWTYVAAPNEAEQYKVGKTVLERAAWETTTSGEEDDQATVL